MGISVRNTVVEAYRLVGMATDNAAIDGTKTIIGVSMLNDIISQLNLNNTFSSTMVTMKFTTSGSDSYTIGPIPATSSETYPDIVADRPAYIQTAYYNNSGAWIKINQIATSDILQFSIDTTNLPLYFAYTPDFPLGVITFANTTDSGIDVALCYNKLLPEVTINDDIAVPPEYSSALKYSLAYELASRNGLSETAPQMKALRDESIGRIAKNMTIRTPLIHSLQGPTRSIINLY